MKLFYITFTFFAILMAFIFIIYLVEIPSPIKFVVETYSLEIK